MTPKVQAVRRSPVGVYIVRTREALPWRVLRRIAKAMSPRVTDGLIVPMVVGESFTALSEAGAAALHARLGCDRAALVAELEWLARADGCWCAALGPEHDEHCRRIAALCAR